VKWELSDEQTAYQETLDAWLGSVAAEETRRAWYAARDTRTFEELFVSSGWAGVGLPEAWGGQGGGMIELALTSEGLGKAAAPDRRSPPMSSRRSPRRSRCRPISSPTPPRRSVSTRRVV